MRLFVDQLTNLDFSYLDDKRGIVGETWLAHIELEGKLDKQGMICDFSHVKKKIRTWLDTHIDHCLLIPTQTETLKLIRDNGTDHFSLTTKRGFIKSSAPSQAHCLINSAHITPQSVADWAKAQLKVLFPDTVDSLNLHFTTEQIEGPFYHYSHGLKKHEGNCQRITHGHRSKIELWKDGLLSTELMSEWATAWQDIYIGSQEDCTNDPNITDNYLFQYDAIQGAFSLSIPKTHCYLIEHDSTVELISKHIIEVLQKQYPHSNFKVKAYEGAGKGAISVS